MGRKKTPVQKTLGKENGKILVFADSREDSSLVPSFLESMGCEVKKIQLETGDYIISERVAIERKTAQDFLTSIMDGRLFNQLVFLAENYEQPLVLIEGTPSELFALSNIHKNAIIGVLASIALNYRVPVLFTENERGTAEFICVIAKRIQLAGEKELSLRKGRPGLTLKEQQRYIVESLPLVGPKTARRLLERFGSVKRVFDASARELEKIEKIGAKKAKKIRKLVDSKYRKEEK